MGGVCHEIAKVHAEARRKDPIITKWFSRLNNLLFLLQWALMWNVKVGYSDTWANVPHDLGYVRSVISSNIIHHRLDKHDVDAEANRVN